MNIVITVILEYLCHNTQQNNVKGHGSVSCLKPDSGNRLFTTASDMNCALDNWYHLSSVGFWCAWDYHHLQNCLQAGKTTVQSKVMCTPWILHLVSWIFQWSSYNTKCPHNPMAPPTFAFSLHGCLFHMSCYATTTFDQSDFYKGLPSLSRFSCCGSSMISLCVYRFFF